MTIELKQSQTAPPQPTSQKVRAHRRTLQLKLDALRAGAPELALQSAMGNLSAQSALAALHLKIKAIEFEIELNHLAVDLAMREDSAAEADWRSAIQELPAEEIIAGVGKGACPSRCQPGLFCVITSAAPQSGGVCGHPITQKHLFFRDETGRVHFPYEDNPRSLAIYKTACKKLGVS